MNEKTKPADVVGAKPDGMRLDARYSGKTVLALGAHPDDIELGIGGTLARLAKSAKVVMAVVCVPNNLERRLSEAARSAAILGGELVVLVAGVCCRVEDLKTYELVEMFDGLAKRFNPALVLSHGASDIHRDHMIVHNACLATQRLAPFDVLCYHPTTTRPATVSFQPKVFVDITDTIDAKMDAIAAHESQFAERGLPIESFREQARDNGRALGLAYAEGLEIGRLLLN